MGSVGRVYPQFGNGKSSPPPAGAYYSVKDQPLPHPATYRSQGRRRGRGACCCCFAWLCSILVILSIVIGLAVLIFWLVVQPRVPKYHVETVTISGLSSTLKTGTLNTNVSVTVMARNPNKHIGFYYDKIYVSAETQGLTIGEGNLPTFYQGHKNTTYINGTLTAEGALTQHNLNLLQSSVGSSAVPLYVKADVKARIKIGSWKSRKITVKVRCNLTIDLTQGTKIIKNSCKIKR